MSWIFQCAWTSPQILCFAECKQCFRDGFHSFSGQANTTVARPGILNCKYSLSKFSPLVSCHLGIWLLLLFFLSPEEICLTENIYLPRGSAIRWVCATVRRDIFFCCKKLWILHNHFNKSVLFCFVFCRIIRPVTKESQTNQKKPQTQETPTTTLKNFVLFEPKNITLTTTKFTSCVRDLRPLSLDHLRKPNSSWKKKKVGCSTY